MAAFLLSLLLLAAGETLWLSGSHLWDGGLLLALGLLGMAWCLRPPLPRRPFRPAVAGMMRLAALLLATGVGIVARGRPGEEDFTGLWLGWLLALGLFAATLLPGNRRDDDPPPPLSPREWAAFAALMALTAALRFWRLGTIPGNFGGDEGIVLDYGRQMLEGPLGNPFATFWLAMPTMSALLYAAVARAFGWTIAAARLPSALAGTLAVGATFFLGRRLGGRRVGWIAAFTMATWAYAIHFSRVPMNNIFDALLAPLAFWALWKALAQREAAHPAWGWSAIAAGLGWYGYWGARWITAMIAAYLAWRAVVEPHFLRRRRAGMRLWVVGWLTTTAPLLLWYTAHPESFTSRSRQVNIFTNGWIEQTKALTGQSTAALLLKQLWHALTAFHLTADTTFWYRPGRPLLDLVGGLLLLIGLVAVLVRLRWPARALTAGWFFSTLLVGWGMTVDPPSSQRGILLIPAVALLIAWGAEAIAERLAPWGKTAQRGFILVLMAVFALTNVNFYFRIYAPRRIYGNPTAYEATEICRYIQTHPMPGGSLYFFGAPYLYWNGLGTFRYLLPDVQGEDIELQQVPEAVEPPARFVFVPQRAGEVEAVKARYPGGRTVYLRTAEGELLAILYDWEPPQ